MSEPTPNAQQFLDGLAAERAFVQFWRALDAGEFDRVAAAFAEQGVWLRQGKELRGPPMVRAAMAERHPGTRTRHLAANVIVDVPGADRAELTCYMCVFHHVGEADARSPAPMNLPITVNQTTAAMVRTPQGWQIERLQSNETFRRA